MTNIDNIRRDAQWVGLTAAELASVSGVPAPTISKLYSGRRALTLDLARPLVAAIEARKASRQAASRHRFDRDAHAGHVVRTWDQIAAALGIAPAEAERVCRQAEAKIAAALATV